MQNMKVALATGNRMTISIRSVHNQINIFSDSRTQKKKIFPIKRMLMKISQPGDSIREITKLRFERGTSMLLAQWHTAVPYYFRLKLRNFSWKKRRLHTDLDWLTTRDFSSRYSDRRAVNVDGKTVQRELGSQLVRLMQMTFCYPRSTYLPLLFQSEWTSSRGTFQSGLSCRWWPCGHCRTPPAAGWPAVSDPPGTGWEP